MTRWHEQIGDPTVADGVLDRLVHNAHGIEMREQSRLAKCQNLLRMAAGVGKILLFVAAAACTVCGTIELSHHHRFGHFVGYGLHTDLVVGNSAIGTQDTHYARLSNFSFVPFRLEGCKFASDVIGGPDSIFFRWDVQKLDIASGRWFSLHGADTWVPDPFGGYWKEEGCQPATLWLAPFRSHQVAWVYKDWVTTGEPVRMAIHTSIGKSPNSQLILYTDTFIVRSSQH